MLTHNLLYKSATNILRHLNLYLMLYASSSSPSRVNHVVAIQRLILVLTWQPKAILLLLTTFDACKHGCGREDGIEQR